MGEKGWRIERVGEREGSKGKKKRRGVNRRGGEGGPRHFGNKSMPTEVATNVNNFYH